MRNSVIAVATIALIGALAWWLIPLNEPSRWRTAIAEAPTGADRYSWTDWAAVEDALGHPKQEALENAAYDADLLETTALRGHAGDLSQMGLSEADLDSELFVQGKDGDADILRLTKSVDPATWKGWTKGDGYWVASSGITSEVFAYVAVADHGRTLIGANNGPYLKRAIAALGQSHPVPATVSGEALSAFTYAGPFACSTFAMARASSEDLASAQNLVARAGTINPVSSYSLARRSATEVTVSFSFETDDQARSNADARSQLAVGAAPGMGGTFSDRFALGQVTASGKVVTMTLQPHDAEPLMGELASGPVLFASC